MPSVILCYICRYDPISKYNTNDNTEYTNNDDNTSISDVNSNFNATVTVAIMVL